MSDRSKLNEAVTGLRAYCNAQISAINSGQAREVRYERDRWRQPIATAVSFDAYNELLRECDKVFRAQDAEARTTRKDAIIAAIRENASVRETATGFTFERLDKVADIIIALDALHD